MFQKFIILFITQLAFLSSCKAQNNQKNMASETSLHYIIRENKDSVAKSPLLILLHGHGSNENDLFSLSNSVPNNWIVASVRGPYQMAENSYRWYDVKMVNGKIVINIDEEERSRKKLMQLIAEMTQKYNVDNEKIVVAGFSQGANMAQSLGLGEPNLITGFGVLSGRFVEEFSPYISKSITLKNSKAFIAHGSGDTMLPKTYASENITKLKELGIQITYCEDSNGHSISTKQWSEFAKWLLDFN
uniref:alpha/beta hydrolase n=1 Tax=Roseivirga sp. TaxID=1964215 RepID=UPI004048CE39